MKLTLLLFSAKLQIEISRCCTKHLTVLCVGSTQSAVSTFLTLSMVCRYECRSWLKLFDLVTKTLKVSPETEPNIRLCPLHPLLITDCFYIAVTLLFTAAARLAPMT
jgi:hypothetical protein